MERTSGAEVARGSTGAGGAFGRYFGVLRRPQTYLNVLYLLLGLPLGTAYFAILVTAIATGGGLTVTVVGLPLLVVTMYGWCVLAAFDRLQTNVLLGAGIKPLNFAREDGPYWSWSRAKARLKNGLTWRSLAFLFLRFPHGLATFIFAAVIAGIPLQMIAMPIIPALGGETDFVIWHVDTVWEALAFVLPGILLVPLSLHLTNLAAALSGRFARVFLDSPGADGELERAAFDRGVIAAATWPGVSIGRPLSASRAHTQNLQLRLFAGHTALFGGLSLLFVILNGLTTPSVWWSAWPIWGMGIAFAAHAGYVLRGVLGLHVALYAVINLGLFVIDAVFSGTSWFFYPLFGWGVLVVAHMLAAQRSNPLSRRIDANLRVGEPIAAMQADTGEHPGRSAAEPALPISVDVAMRRVDVEGQTIDLTPKEFDLLALFAQNPNRPFSRDELLDRVWRNDYEVTDRTIDTHVQRLRKKLGPQAEAIQTVWGVGYKFQVRE